MANILAMAGLAEAAMQFEIGLCNAASAILCVLALIGLPFRGWKYAACLFCCWLAVAVLFSPWLGFTPLAPHPDGIDDPDRVHWHEEWRRAAKTWTVSSAVVAVSILVGLLPTTQKLGRWLLWGN